MKIRQASFALRIVRRRDGLAGIVYRRQVNAKGEERLTRVASIGPLAYSAGASILRSAVLSANGGRAQLKPGPFLPLDPDWGARVACFALVAKGLRNVDRAGRAAASLRHADPTEAAWWFGLMSGPHGMRAIRALRILTEAVK